MPDVSLGALLFLGFLVVQRLSELALSNRNTARLLERGAREAGAAHYPWIVALHTAWILALALWGHDQAIRPGWLALFVVLQAARVWVLATLGARWTTRIIVTDTPLVTGGPFRWLRHPNYAVVAAEIFVAPMVLGLWPLAVIFSLLNGWMLRVRIRAENAALGI